MSLLPVRHDHGRFQGGEQGLQLPQPRLRPGQLQALRRTLAPPAEVRRVGGRCRRAQEDLHRKQDGRGIDQEMLQLPEALRQTSIISI